MTWWDDAVRGPADRVWTQTRQRDRIEEVPAAGTPDEELVVFRGQVDALVAQAEEGAALRGTEDTAALEASQVAKARAVDAVVEAALVLAASPTPSDEVEAAKNQLLAVRERAEGWRNGVSVTFALILATVAITPGEGFMQYEGIVEVALGVLVTASVLLSLAALLLLVRAAHGPGWLKELSGSEATKARYEARAKGAYFDFWCGRVLWGIALLLFLVAVGLTWVNELPA